MRRRHRREQGNLLLGLVGWGWLLSAVLAADEPPKPLSWTGHGGRISFVAFVGDDRRVATGCWDSSIRV